MADIINDNEIDISYHRVSARTCNLQMLRRLIDYQLPDPYELLDVLQMANLGLCIEALQFLLSKGADPRLKNERSRYSLPLSAVIMGASVEYVTRLLSEGVEFREDDLVEIKSLYERKPARRDVIDRLSELGIISDIAI